MLVYYMHVCNIIFFFNYRNGNELSSSGRVKMTKEGRVATLKVSFITCVTCKYDCTFWLACSA